MQAPDTYPVEEQQYRAAAFKQLQSLLKKWAKRDARFKADQARSLAQWQEKQVIDLRVAMKEEVEKVLTEDRAEDAFQVQLAMAALWPCNTMEGGVPRDLIDWGPMAISDRVAIPSGYLYSKKTYIPAMHAGNWGGRLKHLETQAYFNERETKYLSQHLLGEEPLPTPPLWQRFLFRIRLWALSIVEGRREEELGFWQRVVKPFCQPSGFKKLLVVTVLIPFIVATALLGASPFAWCIFPMALLWGLAKALEARLRRQPFSGWDFLKQIGQGFRYGSLCYALLMPLAALAASVAAAISTAALVSLKSLWPYFMPLVVLPSAGLSALAELIKPGIFKKGWSTLGFISVTPVFLVVTLAALSLHALYRAPIHLYKKIAACCGRGEVPPPVPAVAPQPVLVPQPALQVLGQDQQPAIPVANQDLPFRESVIAEQRVLFERYGMFGQQDRRLTVDSEFDSELEVEVVDDVEENTPSSLCNRNP